MMGQISGFRTNSDMLHFVLWEPDWHRYTTMLIKSRGKMREIFHLADHTAPDEGLEYAPPC
jgi:hypothetical protein